MPPVELRGRAGGEIEVSGGKNLHPFECMPNQVYKQGDLVLCRHCIKPMGHPGHYVVVEPAQDIGGTVIDLVTVEAMKEFRETKGMCSLKELGERVAEKMKTKAMFVPGRSGYCVCGHPSLSHNTVERTCIHVEFMSATTCICKEFTPLKPELLEDMKGSVEAAIDRQEMAIHGQRTARMALEVAKQEVELSEREHLDARMRLREAIRPFLRGHEVNAVIRVGKYAVMVIVDGEHGLDFKIARWPEEDRP